VTKPYFFNNLAGFCHFTRAGESYLVNGIKPGKRERSVTRKLLHAFVLLAGLSASAAAKDLQNLGKDGVAIQGYDPVAFFTDSQPVKGNPQFQSDYRGAKYYFASSDHKAMFDKAPSQYEPQFGGYCAYGASRGKTAPVKIEAWQIIDGRLLMQYDLGVKGEFNKDPQGNLKKADQNWPGLIDKYGK
jgi:YHS domain-containing protein